jgi:hypothetical protein
MRGFALLALFALLPPFLSAARLTMRDGSVIYGQFISGSPDTVIFQDNNGVRRRFNLQQVENIEFSNFSPQAAARGPLPGGLRYGDTEADRQDPRDPGDFAVVPVGASLSVRLENGIDRQSLSDRRAWPAVIVQDVLDESGRVVIPRGTPAALVIRRVAEPTTLTSASYILDLDSIRIGAQRYVLNPNPVSSGAEPASALGSLVGAMAAGGRVDVVTAGHIIRVPAGTVLNFRLDQPLHLREAR